MNTLKKLATALAIPLLLINALGGIVAGTWLAILREWRLLGYGIGLAVSGAFFLTIALLPALLLLDAPAALLLKKGYRVGCFVLGFLSVCYTLALLTMWCLTVLLFFTERAGHRSFVPALVWSYGTAMAPVD